STRVRSMVRGKALSMKLTPVTTSAGPVSSGCAGGRLEVAGTEETRGWAPALAGTRSQSRPRTKARHRGSLRFPQSQLHMSIAPFHRDIVPGTRGGRIARRKAYVT